MEFVGAVVVDAVVAVVVVVAVVAVVVDGDDEVAVGFDCDDCRWALMCYSWLVG